MLRKLSIETEKDQIIARLLLQRVYLSAYGGGHIPISRFLSKKEAEHVVEFSVEGDKERYLTVYKEIEIYAKEQ